MAHTTEDTIKEVREISELQERYPFVQHLQNEPISGCPFYGKNGAAGLLIDTHGNQCGLIIERHAQCLMEAAKVPVDVTHCLLVRLVRRQATLLYDQQITLKDDDRPW